MDQRFLRALLGDVRRPARDARRQITAKTSLTARSGIDSNTTCKSRRSEPALSPARITSSIASATVNNGDPSASLHAHFFKIGARIAAKDRMAKAGNALAGLNHGAHSSPRTSLIRKSVEELHHGDRRPAVQRPANVAMAAVMHE